MYRLGMGATCADQVCSTFQTRNADNCCVSDVSGGITAILTLKGFLGNTITGPTPAGWIVGGLLVYFLFGNSGGRRGR